MSTAEGYRNDVVERCILRLHRLDVLAPKPPKKLAQHIVNQARVWILAVDGSSVGSCASGATS